MKTKLAIILVLFLVILGCVGGIYVARKQKPVVSSPSTTTISNLGNKKISLDIEGFNKYETEKNPKIPEYSLPLKTGEITNLKDIQGIADISKTAMSMLSKNGFVVIPNTKLKGLDTDSSWTEKEVSSDFSKYYSFIFQKAGEDIKTDDNGNNIPNPSAKHLPMFVTSDSILHYFHLMFDTTLIKLETGTFYDYVWDISKGLYGKSLAEYNSTKDPVIKEAAKRNVGYFSVALSLLSSGKIDPKLKAIDEKKINSNPMDIIPGDPRYLFTTPGFIKTEVDKELAQIEAHKSWVKSPLFVYEEDYSQYVPRAHYTKSDKLKKYFKAMMWYGRMTMLAKGRDSLAKGEAFCTPEGVISTYDAKIQTAQSILISYHLSQDKILETKLNKLTSIVDFLVGGADDLGPREYLPIVSQNVSNISDISSKIDSLQKSILNLNYNPKIYGGLGKCQMDVSKSTELTEQARGMLLVTKGFRLFGQKFVPDSYWMSMIVSPYSGEYNGPAKKPFTWVKNTVTGREIKGFPRGLDVASILGSSRAEEIIKEVGDANYTDYTKVMDIYKNEVKGYDANVWYKTVYNSWLYALSALFNNFTKGYPSFMLTKAYQDKALTTALASWAQLRHDTLLYVKQSYTMAEMGGYVPPVVVGYVEPIPELYIRLYKSSLIFQNKLSSMLTKEEMPDGFDTLMDVLDKIIVISNKELRNEVLTEEEYNFIDDFASTSEYLIKVLVRNKNGGDIVDGVEKIINPIMVADVHTDGNTKTVLEEAVGKIRTGLFVYRAPQNNNMILGIGPVFSYYEFKQPMDKRMTDEQWRENLFKNIQPDKPEWTSNFYTNY